MQKTNKQRIKQRNFELRSQKLKKYKNEEVNKCR